MEKVLRIIELSELDMGKRSRVDYVNVDKLAVDIQKNGLIQPIAVMERPGEKYLLLAGGRRTIACKALQHTHILCRVFPQLDEYDQLIIEEAENLQREDLSYAEKVAQTKRIDDMLMAKHGGGKRGPSSGHSMQETADFLGRDRTTVLKDIELAKAIEEMPELGDCKNKQEAMKKLGRLKELALTDELSKRFEIKLKNNKLTDARSIIATNYIIGDFFENAAKMEKEMFHCIEVDPPYGIGLDGGIKKTAQQESLNEYNEIAASKYPAFLDQLVKECKRLLKPDGWLILWFANHPWYETVRTTLNKHGFDVRVPAIWVKNGGQTNQPNLYLASGYEPFFYARKGNAFIYKPGTLNAFKFATVHPDKKIHPTERPVELLESILPCFCPPNGKVLVPFLGSGNTILAAANVSMQAVGYDLSDEYRQKFIVKVMSNQPGEYHSYI